MNVFLTVADIYEKHSGLLKPLNVRHIPEGTVVIPGMTGSFKRAQFPCTTVTWKLHRLPRPRASLWPA